MTTETKTMKNSMAGKNIMKFTWLFYMDDFQYRTKTKWFYKTSLPTDPC